MLRLWGKIIKNSKIVTHIESTCDEDNEYQEQLKKCLIDICDKLDIQKPYWLPANLEEYNRIKKTSFRQDNFMEHISFDRFEIEVLEER